MDLGRAVVGDTLVKEEGDGLVVRWVIRPRQRKSTLQRLKRSRGQGLRLVRAGFPSFERWIDAVPKSWDQCPGSDDMWWLLLLSSGPGPLSTSSLSLPKSSSLET